jgi:hypothetical protein
MWTQGMYSILPTQSDRRLDLVIKEEWLNSQARDAMRVINPVIKHVNQWLMTPRRTGSFRRLRRGRNPSDMAMLDECQIAGRITQHTAFLGNDVLATAYKLDGRKLFIRDAVSLMARDILEIQSVVNYYEDHLQEHGSGLPLDTYRWLKEQLGTVAVLLKQAEGSRNHLSQSPAISNEPIAKVIQPKEGSPFAPKMWHDYRTYITAGNYLQMEAVRSTVTRVTWLSDVLVEVLLRNDPKKYFASPLEYVEEGKRSDEIQEGDVAVLAGAYMILAVPNDRDVGIESLIMTNYLKVGLQRAETEVRMFTSHR